MFSVFSLRGMLMCSIALAGSLAPRLALAHHHHEHPEKSEENTFQTWVNENHPANNDSQDDAQTGAGFTCTEAGGNTLACTNLPPSCAQWWPRCARQDFVGGAKIPASCATATFKLVSMANSLPGGDGNSPVSSEDSASPSFAASFATKASDPAPATPSGGTTAATPTPTPAAAPAPAVPTVAASTSLPSNIPAYAAAFLNMGPAPAGLAGSAAPAPTANAAAAAPSGPAPTSAGHYDDPWIDYSASTHTRDALVETLANNPTLRKELREKITAAAADPSRIEQTEYYRRALADAERRSSSRAVLKSLTPLEAFSINAEETDHEVRRLVSSMNGDEESARVPLFPRVHEALQRALAQGNVHIPVKR